MAQTSQHECPKCEYIAHGSFIRVTDEQRDKARITFGKKIQALFRVSSIHDSIVFLGKFTMLGWPGHSAWYLFECSDCGMLQKNYPQGYASYGEYVKLPCPDCRSYIVLTQRRFYEEDEITVPPPLLTWSERRKRRQEEDKAWSELQP